MNSECSHYSIGKCFVTEEAREEETGQDDKKIMKFQIQCLQQELKLAKERQDKLKVLNNQLSNMIVSSNQTSLKKTENYIDKIENIINQKLKITFKDSRIDHKISEISQK